VIRNEVGIEIIILPCGNEGVREGDAYRCWNCMAIYGSIACPKVCMEAGRKQHSAGGSR